MKSRNAGNKPQNPGHGSRGDAATTYLQAIAADTLGWTHPQARLRKALDRDHFLLYAQPIASLRPRPGGRMFLEVLLRLKEEEDNLLPPGGFFHVAEALGMLGEIDDWVLRKTIAWCAGAKGKRVPAVCFINLSADSLLDPEFPERLSAQLERHRLPGHQICLELDESDVITHPDAARRLVHALRDKDCRSALDNFGSIKLSFEHWRALPVDYLKIDGGLIQNILQNPADLARIKAISLTCKRLGMGVIANGVETAGIRDKLREVGVDLAQGYGIRRPTPLDLLDPPLPAASPKP